MPYVIYSAVSGRKAGIAETAPADLAEDGLAATFYETLPDETANVWDPTQRMYVPKPAPTTTVIARQTFMDRLGHDTVRAVQKASVTFPTDNDAVQDMKADLRAWLLRFTIVGDIDVADSRTIGGVDALVAAGLLESERRDAVLAPVPL